MENDGRRRTMDGVNSTMMYCVTFIEATVHCQYNNNKQRAATVNFDIFI
jgi:hypothetical protein